mgnify:CR=1 FL=1
MKPPPLEKIPEAYSVIADERIEIGGGRATVKSSEGKKTYLVEWDGDVYSANDNATYWQGYPGYPIIAVLLLQERLPYNREDAFAFKGINWKKLNAAHKNNYAAALAEVLNRLKAEGIDVDRLNKNLALTHQALVGLDLQIKRGRLKAG